MNDRAALVPNLVGRRVAGRLITDVLGVGEVSAVYRTRHHALGREEVLKVLRESIDLEHTARRMPVLSALRDPHTARIFDFVPPESARALELDHGLILSELVDGRPLSSRPLGTQIGPTASIQIVRQVCESLAEAHQAGLAHGNLKPSNIVLVDGVDGISVRVLDYGLVPRLDLAGDLRRSDRPLYGHPAYLAPECILLDAAASPRTDIYALGLIFYELLSGENPMRRGSTSGMLRRQIEHVPPPVTGERISPDLADLIASMIAKQPELRPTSVVQIQQILTSLEVQPRSGDRRGDRPGGRRTITGSHEQVGEQFAEAYTEVVDEREGMRAEIERARTLTAQARRQAQRWRTLALAGFTLAAVCLIALVFMLLQAPPKPEPARRAAPRTGAAPSTPAAGRAPVVIPDAQIMDAAGMDAAVVDAAPPATPASAPATAAPMTAAPVTATPVTAAPASAAPPIPEPVAADWPAAPTAPAIALVDVGRTVGGRLYAARSEVTRSLWQRLMGGDDADSPLPATRMTFAETIRFLNRLSKREKLSACYRADATPIAACTGYRLPTEAEWLQIARFAHPSGPPPRSGARYWKHGLKGPAPVCASGVARGLCDMYGNVWEWTSTGSKKARIRRGGSWMHSRKDAGVKVRHGVRKRAPYLGVRPVRVAEPAPFAFGGLQIDPLGRTISVGDDEPLSLTPAAAAILFDGLRAKGGVVALPELGERVDLELPALRAGADALRTALDQLDQTLRAVPAGADGVRLILKP